MAETSGFWTTGVSGDGLSKYTQSDWAEAAKILAAAAGYEGVVPGYSSEFACVDGGVNTVDVDPGGAVVDGKWHKSSVLESINIPSAVGGGNTRIDRIVLRADWSARTVRITRIAGTDASSPVAPALTQTPGTTYDIPLCQVLVDTGGNVTVTDERTWARASGVTVAARRGGSATNWHTPGTTEYAPAGLAKLQVGAETVSISSGVGNVAMAFPEAFGAVPVFTHAIIAPSGQSTARLMFVLTSISASAIQGYIRSDGLVSTWDGTATLLWMAMGPE